MKSKRREEINGGLILVAIGLIFLASRFVNFGDNLGLLILPSLGAIFMISGILKRKSGLMIPGGILSGIGVGSYLVAGPIEIAPIEEGGLFMLAFGLGFASITLFSFLFGQETYWWALIPAGIMGLIGLGVSFGGIFLSLLEWAGAYWPLLLIGIGGYSILKAWQTPALKEKSPESELI